MNWDILQRWKIFYFYWKNFHFSENFFTLLDFQACPNSVQMKKLEIFPLWWKIFHFQKSAKKIFFFAELHELEHSAEVENFPLLVDNFPLW